MRKPEFTTPVETLNIPENLLPSTGKMFPSLDLETLDELKTYGWQRVGILSVFVDSDMNIMMLKHNGRDKNKNGALGILGETSQHSGPVIEQPIETLFRGIDEELGVSRPQDLDLWTHKEKGWVINQWPLGINAPGKFACGIAFPVFLTDTAKNQLLGFKHGTDEIQGIEFMPHHLIREIDDSEIRPGVKDLLEQMDAAGLLMPDIDTPLSPLDFSTLYRASLQDIDL